MAPTLSDRLKVYVWPLNEDPFNREQLHQSHLNLEARAAIFLSGTFANRPTASSAARGFYLATDQNAPVGVLYYSDGTAWHALNNSAGDQSTANPGDAASPGSSSTFARSDHVHQMLPWGSPVGVGTALADGVANAYARADHVHVLNNGSVTQNKLATAAINLSAMFSAGVVDTAAIGSQAVTRDKIAVSERIPTGTVLEFAGATAPTGFLLANGASHSTATYPDLFAVIGYTYGGSGGFFNVPDRQGYVGVGVKSGDADFAARGQIGGAKTVTLTPSQMPEHAHGVGTLTTAPNGQHQHSVNGTAADGGVHAHTFSLQTSAVPDHQHPIQLFGTSSSGAHNHAWDAKVAQAGFYTNIFGVNVTFDTAGVAATNQGGGSSGYSVGGTINDSVAHQHTVTGTTNQEPNHQHTLSGSTANNGSNAGHNNLQPYIVMNYIIKT